MARRALTRRSTVVAAAFTIVSGLVCSTAPAAQAATFPETVIPAAYGSVPLTDSVAFAGPGGFLHKPQGDSGYVWTTYSGGADVPVSGDRNYSGAGYSGAGSDTVATVSGSGVELRDMDAGTTTTLTVPAGQSYAGTFGSHVLTQAATSGSATPFHVLTMAGGQQTDTPVAGWPTGMSPAGVLAGDANTAVVRYYNTTGGSGLVLLDLAAGQATPVFGTVASQSTAVSAMLTDTYVAWYDTGGQPVVHLLRRSGLTGPETTVTVPAPTVSGLTGWSVRQLAIAGDSLLIGYGVSHTGPHTVDDYTGYPLYAMPLTGGTLSAVLDHVSGDSLHTDPNGALAVGGSSVRDWAARQVTAATDGTMTTAVVDAYPEPPTPVAGLSLAGGQLLTLEPGSSPDTDAYTRTIGLGNPPSYGPHTSFGLGGDCRTADAPCPRPLGSGDGRTTRLSTDSAGDWVIVEGPAGVTGTVNPGGTDGAGPAGPTGGTLVDSDGRYSVYDNTATGKQYIADTTAKTTYGAYVFAGGVLFTRPITGAALSGETLWAAGSTAGALSAIDLPTRQTIRTVTTGVPCVPSEVQTAGGRWIYWSCGASGPAGVYDLATNKEIPVPSAGLAQLGDGYLVEHDTGRAKLVLTDFHTGTAVTGDLADLPAGPLTDDRRVTWAVDAYGGGIAYVDAQRDIHLIDPHVPASPASGYRMLPGQRLNPGDSLGSGSMRLVMQSDGNLVAYVRAGGSSAPAEWASGTYGHPGAYAVMQPDGNLVVYAQGGGPGIGGALWASGTYGRPGAYAVLQEDGNLVVYRSGSGGDRTGALWASGSYARPQTVSSGEVLKPGWWTQGKRTFLVMQPDGNLVMYRKRDGAAIWSTRTSGHPGAYAVMQSDGNLVVYRKGSGPGSGGALWASGTSGRSGAWAWMQDDGNFVIYPRQSTTIDATGALWSSGTWRTSS